ncbi:MAG TPA: PAS domain S-box protein [Verrucomicrobiae bacterium]|nr:PAS domain S-box protein [Verrucomicrobiae bacterium]
MPEKLKPGLVREPMRVMLIGSREEDFFLIREILQRTPDTLAAELDHAHSLEEARAMLCENGYNLVLFEHETVDARALELLRATRRDGNPVPFVVLTEHADERAVAEIIAAGAWDCVERSQLDGVNLIRTIRNTLALSSLQQIQQTAEESLRKLSLAVEQSADAIIVTDRSGIIEYVNPAFETLTGYTREEIRGKTPRILKSGEQDRETYQQMWGTILSGSVFRGILVNRKKSGELYYVEESISPVRDADGAITHFISNGRDLTDRLRLEAQLLQAQKMDAIGRLAGGVAHDFNNLLTIITSYAELALDSVPRESPLEAKLQEILAAARRAALLTRQLLAFSRKQPRALRVTDINQVISDITRTLPRLIGEDVSCGFVPGENLGAVRVDPVQIEQILMNLAANARDAMPQGGHLRIETSSVILDEEYIHDKPAVIPKGNYVLITVSDNGTGISPEDLSHIFEPFYTTKDPGKGTGLGLATVYGIVKQNKGFIWPYSEPGRGSVFRIYLPCFAVKGRTVEMDAVDPKNPAKGSETILLVEDEDSVRRATAESLQLQGYTVLEARDGLDALTVAKNHGAIIHLAVTDVVMPNMSGGELARQLLQVRPEMKLLFVSGYAGQTVLDHKVFDLETNFLQKPFSLKQLSAKIREALHQPARSDNNQKTNELPKASPAVVKKMIAGAL